MANSYIFSKLGIVTKPHLAMKYSPPSIYLTIFFILIGFHSQICSQENYFKQEIEQPYNDYSADLLINGKTSISYSFGLSFEFGKKKNNSLKGYVAISAIQQVKGLGDYGILVGAQSKLIIYRGGLGTSFFNQKNFIFNIDSRNTISLLLGGEKNNWIGKPIFVEPGMNVSSHFDPFGYSFGLGTTFINGINHRRNQQIGSLSLAGGPFTFQYYNDGTPFGLIGSGDLFDRYWTGGGSFGYYSKKDNHVINEIIVRYDNYTGYQPNLFDVAGLLDINNMPYKSKEEQFYNQARYKYTLGMYSNNRFSMSVWEPIYTDIQNFIHYNISNDPFHARPFGRRITMGYDYIYFN